MMAAGLFFAEPFPAQAAEPMPAGVSVDGESLEGLTEAEAEEQVQSRVDEKLAREVALTIGEMSFAASSGDLGIAWKNEDQVRQALKDAEVKGNLIQRYMKKNGSGSGAGGSGAGIFRRSGEDLSVCGCGM